MRTRLGMFLLAGLLAVTSGYAQKKNFSYKFYGQVRGDLFYNSRQFRDSRRFVSSLSERYLRMQMVMI